VLTLHQFEISPFCDKIRRVLHWKRQPYRVHEVSLFEVATRFKKVNRAGKVPALDDGGHIVCDSTEIARYLEQRFPERPLLPADPADRARCHVLEDWADESLYFYEMRLRFTIPANARRWVPVLLANDPPLLRSVAALAIPTVLARTLAAQGVGRKSLEAALTDVRRHVAAVGAMVGDDGWLVGKALTLADISVFAQFFCIQGAAEGAAIIAADARVAGWMARVDAATSPPP
jgi:glutathione S-transferase